MQLYVAILPVVVLVLSTKSEAEKTITMEDKEKMAEIKFAQWNSSMPVNPEELNVKGDIVLPPRKNLASGPVGNKQRIKSLLPKLNWKEVPGTSSRQVLPPYRNYSMLVNPEELNIKGDIVLPPRKKLGRRPVGNKPRIKSLLPVLNWKEETFDLPLPDRWPTSVIPYVIDKEFTNEEKKLIFEAMADYHRNTCVKFQPRNKEADYIHITGHHDENPGCHADLGHIGGRQGLNLERSEKCVNKRTVIHELMHALGFPHEHQRPDRHKYIQIHEHNIKERYRPQFWKLKEFVNHFGFGYDYESVLHYLADSATSNGLPTITVFTPGYMNIIGRIPKLSDIDIRKINIMFNCTCSRN